MHQQCLDKCVTHVRPVCPFCSAKTKQISLHEHVCHDAALARSWNDIAQLNAPPMYGHNCNTCSFRVPVSVSQTQDEFRYTNMFVMKLTQHDHALTWRQTWTSISLHERFLFPRCASCQPSDFACTRSLAVHNTFHIVDTTRISLHEHARQVGLMQRLSVDSTCTNSLYLWFSEEIPTRLRSH